MTAVTAPVAPVVPSEISDPVNARILAVSEDRIAGFVNEPFAQIAFGAELPEELVIERLRAMLASAFGECGLLC